MSVVSVKVPPKTKKEMAQVEGKVDWPSEIRGFIESRLEQERRRDALSFVDGLLEKIPSVPKGTSARIVREDRDRGH
ncbi:MAG: type II toxin-antitoxin system VapB family antitoxin [Nitrososphaerales archaeon]